MILGGPYQLEYEVIQMFLKLDAKCLQFRYGIIELDGPESKKSNQYLLFKNLEVTLILRKLKQTNLVTCIFKIYTYFLVNLLKLQIKQKMTPCLVKKTYLQIQKQLFNSTIIINNSKEHETKLKILCLTAKIVIKYCIYKNKNTLKLVAELVYVEKRAYIPI